LIEINRSAEKEVPSRVLRGRLPEDHSDRGRILTGNRPQHIGLTWGLGGTMRHYRNNTVTKLGGPVIKKKDVLAASDQDALKRARDADDCPVCEVLKDGKQIGTVV